MAIRWGGRGRGHAGRWSVAAGIPTPTPTPASLAASADPITVAENAAFGSTVFSAAVINPSGSYAFTLVDGGAPSSTATSLVDNADNTADILVASLDYETFPSISVVVQADNGLDAPLIQSFSVTVTDVAETPSGNIAPILIAMGMM